MAYTYFSDYTPYYITNTPSAAPVSHYTYFSPIDMPLYLVFRDTNFSKYPIEYYVRPETLYMWGKYNDILSEPVSAKTSVVSKKSFNDKLTHFRTDKWATNDVGCLSYNDSKVKISSCTDYTENILFSFIKFTGSFNVQVKIESQYNSEKAGIVFGNKPDVDFTPFITSPSVTGYPIFGAYAASGNLYYGLMNGTIYNIPMTGSMYVKYDVIYSSKTINMYISEDGINCTLQYSHPNPIVGSAIQWPIYFAISNYSNDPTSYSEYSNFKINSGNYEYAF